MKKTVKHTNSKKDKLEYLVSVGIILLTLIFIILLISSQFVIDYRLSKSIIKKDEFNDIKDATIYIDFDEMTTSIIEYKQMHEACKDFIRTYDTVTTNIDTSVVVTEHTYIDTNGNIIKDNKEDKLHETGPIYLQDKLIIRYINEKGEMRIAGCRLNTSFDTSMIKSDKYTVVDIDNLKDLFVADTNSGKLNLYIDSGLNNKSKKYNYKQLKLSTEEDRYITELENIFVNIITNNSDIKEAALKYFTYDGYLTILNGIHKLRDTDTNINIVFSEAGKSSLDINYKDRLIMQIETISNDTKVITNVIVKLNEYNKVFDIDII